MPAAAAARDRVFATRSGQRDPEGGTSVAAPFHAALIALANERRARAGKRRVGFVNDRLNAVAAAKDVFIDITGGDDCVAPDSKG